MVHGSRGNGGAPALALGLFTGGSLITYASAAGVSNDVNPGSGWPSAGIGRLNVDTSAGNAEWTGLAAPPIDGYGVLIKNVGANQLQIDNANAGSLAANRFDMSGNLILTQNQQVIAIYTSGSVNLWYVG